jgi:hypothetical protein
MEVKKKKKKKKNKKKNTEQIVLARCLHGINALAFYIATEFFVNRTGWSSPQTAMDISPNALTAFLLIMSRLKDEISSTKFGTPRNTASLSPW